MLGLSGQGSSLRNILLDGYQLELGCGQLSITDWCVAERVA